MSTPTSGGYPPNPWGDQGGPWQQGQPGYQGQPGQPGQPGYPPAQSSYPQAQSGYSPAPPGYPPAPPGYPVQPGYPPTQSYPPVPDYPQTPDYLRAPDYQPQDYPRTQGYYQPTSDPESTVHRGPAGGFPSGPPPRRRGSMIAAIAAAVVVIAGAVVGVVLWLGSGSKAPGGGHAIATPPPASSGALPTQFPGVPASGASGATGSNGSPGSPAWSIGACFAEQGAVGNITLSQVPCQGDQAVFVINAVIPMSSQCPGGSNYRGDVIGDRDAKVNYCVSLVVPAGQCFVYDDQSKAGNAQVVQRTSCGGAQYVVQVQSIERATDPNSACANVSNADIWYYQSPTSGQFACVVQAGG